MNFKLCDTKGLEIDDGIDTAEFCYILDGNMPDKYLVQKHNIYLPNEFLMCAGLFYINYLFLVCILNLVYNEYIEAFKAP